MLSLEAGQRDRSEDSNCREGSEEPKAESRSLVVIRQKVPKHEFPRVCAMVVDGRTLQDLVDAEFARKGPKARLTATCWTPVLRKYNCQHNPVAHLRWPKAQVSWPLAFVDALTDCHSEGRCQRGHGLAALKAGLDECDSLPQGAVWGFPTVYFRLRRQV